MTLQRRVVITGAGIITALGIGKEQNWTKLKSGISGISGIKSFDASGYRTGTGGEAGEFVGAPLYHIKNKRLDRASHLLVHAAREAVAEAGLAGTIGSEQIFSSLGTTLGGMLSGQAFHKEVLKKGLPGARRSLVFDYLAQYQTINLFREFELKGDFLVFSNACASGANAVGHAFNYVRSGRYDTALCGGYDTMSEFTFAGFNSLMALTQGACRPFDLNRDGLVLGEGAGILVLEEREHARKRGVRILGEIAGYGESSDAYHITRPDPSGKPAAAAITGALKDAAFPCIDYINAHGTGTAYNDVMETNAIINAFGESGEGIPVSSVKPMVGHTLGAAGAIEAIASLLSIMNRTIVPNINFETPDPACGLNIIREAAECDVKTVLSNSFGFGGSNAALIIKGYESE